jgi:hypothetical protein
MHTRFNILIGIILGFANEVNCQQVQTGHYAPGWNGKLKAGMVTSEPGLYMMNTTMFFHAQKFKDGNGEIISTSETDYILNALAIAWRPDLTLFGGDYQAVVTPAFGNFSGRPVLVDGVPQDAPFGFTDIFFSPLGLGWHWSEFHLLAALGGFAPTGRFTYGDSDNSGLGFWTVMPFTTATYRTNSGIFTKVPLLMSGGLFYETHSNQQGHDFRPGDSFTFEWSAGIEFGEQSNIGVSGYIYRQVTDPTGADAQAVDKYQSNGLGITFSHVFKSIQLDVRAYQDFNIRNGPEGTLVYLDISWGWVNKGKI